MLARNFPVCRPIVHFPPLTDARAKFQVSLWYVAQTKAFLRWRQRQLSLIIFQSRGVTKIAFIKKKKKKKKEEEEEED